MGTGHDKKSKKLIYTIYKADETIYSHISELPARFERFFSLIDLKQFSNDYRILCHCR